MRPSCHHFALGIAWGALLLAASVAHGQTYNVVLNTGAEQAAAGKIAFDTVVEDGFNSGATCSIYEFTTSGTMGFPETEGGLVAGDLVLGLNPAFFTSIASDFYYNHLAVTLDPIGSSTTFGVEFFTSEFVPPVFPDAMGVYLLDPSNSPLITTSDPTGTNALFSIEGATSVLAVYDPAMFAEPDSIILNSGIVGLPSVDEGTPRYLRFRNVYPNPAPGETTIRFDIPVGMERVALEVFDLRGAHVVTLSKGELEPGVHTITWLGTDRRGRRLAPGLYMLRLVTERGHYVARKVMLVR